MNTQRLIAKIVQLQTSNMSLTNKLEFMQDHAKQLTEELRKKSRFVAIQTNLYGLLCIDLGLKFSLSNQVVAIE